MKQIYQTTYKFVSLFLLAILLNGCLDKEEGGTGRYGMMSEGTPQYTAVEFMQAVYVDKDMDKILALSSERYSKVLKNYYTARTIQRQVFNLRLDTMQAEAVSGGALLFSESRKNANIEVKIEGNYQNDKVIDLKTIVLVKEKGDWKVNAVKEAMP